MNGPDYSALYRNKLIEPGEYLARLASIHLIESDNGKPIYQIGLVLDYNESDLDKTRLSVILQPTSKGQRFIDAFLESYRITEKTTQQAIGRFAAVYVYQTQYKGSHYSAVKFHPQPYQVQDRVAELEMEEDARRRKISAPTCGLVGWHDVANDGVNCP